MADSTTSSNIPASQSSAHAEPPPTISTPDPPSAPEEALETHAKVHDQDSRNTPIPSTPLRYEGPEADELKQKILDLAHKIDPPFDELDDPRFIDFITKRVHGETIVSASVFEEYEELEEPSAGNNWFGSVVYMIPLFEGPPTTSEKEALVELLEEMLDLEEEEEEWRVWKSDEDAERGRKRYKS